VGLDQLEVGLAVGAAEWPAEGHPGDAVVLDTVDEEGVCGDVVEGPDDHDVTGLDGGGCY
jgi:hypothetical protein